MASVAILTTGATGAFVVTTSPPSLAEGHSVAVRVKRLASSPSATPGCVSPAFDSLLTRRDRQM
jgi:hypothetical protein